MAERLLNLSTVLLYGRRVEDLEVRYSRPDTTPIPNTAPGPTPRLSANNFLDNQLGFGSNADPVDDGRRAFIARIYGFSFEGHYYDLASPTLFLVHGLGTLAEGPLPSNLTESQRYSRAPGTADRTGMGSQLGSFASDIRVWSYDKADFSIRLNASTGTLDEILLETELSGDRLKTQIGAAAMMRMMRATRGPGGAVGD